MEKSKLAPISVEQKKLLVEYVQKYPNLATQKFSHEFTFKRAQSHWEELSEILNSIPGGSKKGWMQWRKTWTDIKNNVKNKAATAQRYMQGTGGGPAVPKEREITDLEKDILEIIGNVAQSGNASIIETPVILNFVNLEESEDNVNKTKECEDRKESPNTAERDFYLNPLASSTSNVTPHKISSVEDHCDHAYSFKSNKVLMNLKDKGKRLSVTRRLENSQKATAEMLKSMDCRTSMMEHYYKEKYDYMTHVKKYHEKKIQLKENNNEVLKEILKELKIVRQYFVDNEHFI